MSFKTSNLEELILPLKVQIGDTDPVPTYSDEYLHMVLREAVAALMRRWRDQYYVDNDGVVHRNPNEIFNWSSPPVIQHRDRRVIVLQASITIKGGKKFSELGNIASWKDEEISYSNIEGARQRSSTLADAIAELENLLPVKRLARAKYGRQYGWQHDYS